VAPVGRRQRPESSGLLLRLGLCGAFALNAMVFTLPRYLGMEPDFVLARLFSLLTLACASLSLLVGGGYFIRRALAALRRGVLHIDLPISLGIVFAYAGSLVGWARDWERFIYFDFVAIFVFLMLVGRWTQERAVDYNRHRLVARSRRPDTVRLAGSTDGDTPAMPLAQLTADTAIRVDPGDVVPVLSRLGSSAASCSLEWINGESAMRRFAGGELVPGGAVNIGIDPIELRTCESWPDSLLARLLREEQQDFRNPLLERVLRVYLGVVLALAAAGWAFWTFGPPGDPLGAFQVLLSVLVVSCPCAFGVAAPLAQEWAILRLRGAGLFVREATLFARLAGIRHIIFDKTGTLTLEAPRLLQPETLGAMPASARAVLRRLVADSLHPVGRALRQALRALPPDAHAEPVPALTVREEIGQGLAAVAADGAQWTLGRPGWRDSGGTAAAGRDVVLARAGQPVAAFAFAEALRDDAVGTLAQLRQRHELWILSGDQPAKVARMAARLGLPAANAHGGLDPAAKAAWVARLDRGDTLYIGDGVNDSLAFDRAAARGTPVVDRGLLEGKADFFFTGNGLGALPRLFAIGRLRQRATRTVFGFTICYNIVVAAVALAGQMHPLLAAIVMPLSSLVSIGLVAWAFRKA
jgi:Cu2+-exporting ATPase